MLVVSGILFLRMYLITCSGGQLPFALIAHENNLPVDEIPDGENSADNKRKCKYRPQPDVSFLKHNFPRFLAEFDSSSNHTDEQRLHVQMACTVRLARALKKDAGKAPDFFLMGAFVSESWRITRYFCWVDEEKVRFETPAWINSTSATSLPDLLSRESVPHVTTKRIAEVLIRVLQLREFR